MRRPANSPTTSFNFGAMARKIDVDNRITVRNYYRIADNLLKQLLPFMTAHGTSPKMNTQYTRISSPNSLDSRFQKLYVLKFGTYSHPETLFRHSLLGPNGLSGQWMGPRAEIKVRYPTNIAVESSELSSMNVEQLYPLVIEGRDSKVEKSAMESVLSLDDGNWLNPAEESGPLVRREVENDDFQMGIVRQPMPPPVMAQVQPELLPTCSSRISDPGPGSQELSQDRLAKSSPYKDLHIPVKMMEDFLRLAQENTMKNLETCGILAGSLRNRIFHITALIIPKQESTSDSCQTLNEEEIFDYQDTRSLFPLGWIHTHPTQTCFMSSVDLHTHYSYQVMLPEAIAIVMAPTDISSPHGIFHLSDPGGVAVIRNCQQRGFHPHEEPEDSNPIYESCSHVYMNPKLNFDVVDLR